MTDPAKKPDIALEADPVWDLVDKAPTQPASAHFVRKTVQMVREKEERQSWWKQLLAPMPIAGLAAATATIAMVINLNFSTTQPTIVQGSPISAEAEAIQEVVEVEMLKVAAENPSEFSDQELVALLGF